MSESKNKYLTQTELRALVDRVTARDEKGELLLEAVTEVITDVEGYQIGRHSALIASDPESALARNTVTTTAGPSAGARPIPGPARARSATKAEKEAANDKKDGELDSWDTSDTWYVVSDRSTTRHADCAAALQALLARIATERIDVVKVDERVMYEYTVADYDEVVPDLLYIGGAVAATSAGFDCMINCTDDLRRMLADSGDAEAAANYVRTGWEDSATQPLTGLSDHVRQLDEWLTTKKRVLVYCKQGQSRSAALVLAYLLRFQLPGKTTATEALEYLRTKRPAVRPNLGFMAQLDEFVGV